MSGRLILCKNVDEPSLLGSNCVDTGCMCAGKSFRLISRLQELRHDFPKLEILKHAGDTRWDETKLISRAGISLSGVKPVSTLGSVQVQPRTLYAVDELHFFQENDALQFIDAIVDARATCVMAGLDFDFAGQPFESTRTVMQSMFSLECASEAHRMVANCSHGSERGTPCGRPATLTQRLLTSTRHMERYLVGGDDLYQPACCNHHSPEPQPRDTWC